MEKKIKVTVIESKKLKDCEYCEGKGHKEIKFFEDFRQEETSMSYLCPACNGYKMQEDEGTEISYHKTKIKFAGEQILTINGKEIALNMEGEPEGEYGQDFTYGKTLTDSYLRNYENQFGGENVGEEEDEVEIPSRYELIVDGELFYLVPKKDMGTSYFYFDTEEEADKFIEEKEKVIL